eukprot:949374_1
MHPPFNAMRPPSYFLDKYLKYRAKYKATNADPQLRRQHVADQLQIEQHLQKAIMKLDPINSGKGTHNCLNPSYFAYKSQQSISSTKYIVAHHTLNSHLRYR